MSYLLSGLEGWGTLLFCSWPKAEKTALKIEGDPLGTPYHAMGYAVSQNTATTGDQRRCQVASQKQRYLQCGEGRCKHGWMTFRLLGNVLTHPDLFDLFPKKCCALPCQVGQPFIIINPFEVAAHLEEWTGRRGQSMGLVDSNSEIQCLVAVSCLEGSNLDTVPIIIP